MKIKNIMNNKVVYRHVRLDNDQVFYIGMGNENRAYQISGRNAYWEYIYSNYGYKVEIVDKNLSRKDALDLETSLIKSYGRLIEGGTLVNLVDDSRKTRSKLAYKKSSEQFSEFGKRTYWVDPIEIMNREFSRENKKKQVIKQIELFMLNIPDSYIDISIIDPIFDYTVPELLEARLNNRRRYIESLMTEDQKSIIKNHNKKYIKR